MASSNLAPPNKKPGSANTNLDYKFGLATWFQNNSWFRTVLDILFLTTLVILLGDLFKLYYLPYIALLPLAFFGVILLILELTRWIPSMKIFLAIAVLVLAVVTGYVITEVTPKGLQDCPNVDKDALTDKDIRTAYKITRTIQGIDSVSGNAIMLAEDRGNGRPVVVKYYADPNAGAAIGFACGLEGKVARLFPTTLRTGTVITPRGEALFTVQTVAEGEPIDSWLATGQSSTIRRGCALSLIDRAEKLTESGLCHRDLHPGNVFVSKTGIVSFIDLDLGFVNTNTTAFTRNCQRFFFEMPLRLVVFANENLSEIRRAMFFSWWAYMSTEYYGVFSVDQLYLVAQAFIVKNRTKILSSLSTGTPDDPAVWSNVRKAIRTPVETSVEVTAFPSSSATAEMMSSLLMNGIGGISTNLTVDPGAQTKLELLWTDFSKNGNIPRTRVTSIVSSEINTSVVVNNRLTVDVVVPAASNLDIRSQEGVNDIHFSVPLQLSTTGLQLSIDRIRIDKTSEIDTKYNIEGKAIVGGTVEIDIADQMGEVVTPNGPLPTGNEILFLVSSLKFNEEQIKDVLASVGTVTIHVDKAGDSTEDTFVFDFTDPDNVTVT